MPKRSTLHRRRDILFISGTWTAGLLVSGFFLWLISDIVWHGIQGISWQYFTTAPIDAGRAGGIGPIIVSTLLMLLICLVVALPISLGCAIYLAEYTPPYSLYSRIINTSLDILVSMPSIVFGLFGNAFFSIILGLGFSILSGGLTLACMVLPLLIRTTEDGLRAVSHAQRINATALGLSRISIIFHVLIPISTPAIIVGLVLSIGRALAETAALLYTAGYVSRMPESLLDSGRALSVHIFDLSMNVPGGNNASYTAALTLIILLLIINSSTHWLKNHFSTQ